VVTASYAETLNVEAAREELADPITDPNYDPMAAGTMIGHGPFMCLDPRHALTRRIPATDSSRSEGRAVHSEGGRFLLTRNDNYYLGAPKRGRLAPEQVQSGRLGLRTNTSSLQRLENRRCRPYHV